MAPSGIQPFRLGDSYVVCNGEIYGFKKLKEELSEKYIFKSESYCEILLPMYLEYGTAMFAMLDAEFACIIYDGDAGEFIAARDPIGIRPLYYGYDKEGAVIFASEAKNLVGLTDNILPFPPGCYYKSGQFIRYCDIAKVDRICRDDLETVCKHIHDKLIAGVEKRLVADAKVGFLLSGGLDSSLVCAIAAKKSKEPIKTFAIGMSEDAIDLKYARQAEDYIGSEHTEIYMTPDEVISSLEKVIQLLGTYDITTIRASMGMYLVCKSIHEQTDIRVLLTGEVSDELFGYKYTDFAPDAMAFQMEAQKRISEHHMYDVLLKINTYGKGKYLLRRAFEDGDYLPEEILWREKAAFSDAVGHSMVDYLKEYAENKYTDKECERMCKKYTYARPFTKESLLYREIFETYYPGQAELVAGYWMPNKEWEGCDVKDPSARVLSNYGDSGK